MALFEELLTASPKELIYTVFIPFIIAFAIFWGILSALNIFGKKINLVLALAISVSAFYFGAFGAVSSFLLSFSANLAVVAFVILFIVGILIWSARTGMDIFTEPEKKSRKISERIEKLYKELDRTRDHAKQEAIERQIAKLRWQQRVVDRRARERYR